MTFTAEIDSICAGVFAYVQQHGATIDETVALLQSHWNDDSASDGDWDEKPLQFDSMPPPNRHSYRIRPATADDWAQIQQVHEAAFKACHAPLLEAGAETWFDPTGTCFVAEQCMDSGVVGGDGGVSNNNAVTGFVYCCPGDQAVDWARGAAFVDDLYVSPAYQRQGLGRALLRTAEQHLARQGCETAVLATMTVLKPTHAFYEVGALSVVCCVVVSAVKCDTRSVHAVLFEFIDRRDFTLCVQPSVSPLPLPQPPPLTCTPTRTGRWVESCAGSGFRGA